ncbi:MAG: FAD-dependent oxidoreductase [Eubacteriales bacterium]|nr:FAD-dependent oxidoreductase [Eubacteriales bacterium]
MYDVIIIGSGPAGLSASVYAKRAKMDVMVIEKEPFSGGQIVNTECVDNYLGLNGTSGYELATKFREHADSLEVPFVTGEVIRLSKQESSWICNMKNGDAFETKNVVIATGARYRHLNVSGEEELKGAGVSYCATCDGAFFRNKDVVVVGGGDVAIGDALYLANLCNKVYLVHRRDTFRAANVLVERMKETGNIEFLPFHEVREIQGSGMVQSVHIVNNQTQEENDLIVSGVFVAVGMEPETSFVNGMVKLDDAGYIVADETGVTSENGIYVAGDVRTKVLRQVSTAVSDGANVIASIERNMSN